MNQARFAFRICAPPTAIMMLWFVLTSFADTLLAQSAGETQESSFTVDNTVPEKVSDSDRSSAARLPLSSVPWFLRNMRQGVGFSLGAYGAYDSNAIAPSSGQLEGLKSAWLTPSLFANSRKRHSQILFNYSFQARAYAGFRQLNTSSHTATLNLTEALSPKLSIGLGEVFSSALNYNPTFLAPTVLGSNELNPAQNLDVSSQRVTRNSITTSASYTLGRRNNISVFSNYDYFLYTDQNLGNPYDVLVGVHTNFRINKWLSLDDSYSHYLVGNILVGGGSQIHHLQVGGLRLDRSRKGWEAYVSGGADISTSGGAPLPIPSMQAGVSKNWKSGQFSLSYSRGFWAAVGVGISLQGDTTSLSFNQSFRRMSITLGSIYRRGTPSGGSSVDFLSPAGELGFALQRHLMLTADYSYVSQRVVNISPDFQNSSRYRLGIGINCTLPPLFTR